jgi:hypothetical protein
MSKAVKSVGRAIGKVVKGVVKTVKKVASSKFGKIILAAATVYFGGAAIMGAMGGASAGTGFLGTLSGAVQGAGAGISSAWGGLTGSLTGGGFSALGQGFTGAYGAGSGAVTAANAAAVQAAGGGFGAGGYGSVGTTGQTAAGTTLSSAPTAALTTPPPGGGGIISNAWNGLGDYGKMAAVQGTTQLVGGAIQGAGQQKAMEEQRNYELEQQQAARNRYNENVGTNWWSGGGNGMAQTSPSSYAQAPQTGLVAGYMTPQERYAEEMRRRMGTYDPYALPTA